MKKSKMVKVAKLEIEEWRGVPRSLVMMILFAFIHRVTTGETVEETFFGGKDDPGRWFWEI